MRRAFILVPLLALTACATPRETCISNASARLAVLNQLIAQTEANLARGYGIETEQEVRVIDRHCRGRNADGTTFLFPCQETLTFDREVPVALDLTAEQAKLVSLRRERDQQIPVTNAAVQQCIAANPE